MFPLGCLTEQYRNQQQNDAHEAAVRSMPRFAISGSSFSGPVKVILTDFWRDPLVVKDVGMEFPGFHQLTGSCVGVSAGDGVFTLSAIQRKLATNPTKALIPWWPFSYGRTRDNEGDRGQGEGAVVSIMARTLQEGVFDCHQSGLPSFRDGDGLMLTEQVEMQWSDGARIPQQFRDLARSSPVGTVAPVNSTDEIYQSIVNGYPVIDGCDLFVQRGSVQGSGADACVIGDYDSRGGHATCFLGVWDHPQFGRLFLYSNQWPTSTYPRDPAGGGRCCVWLREASVARAFSSYGMRGEAFALSHLNYFPAQPELLNYIP